MLKKIEAIFAIPAVAFIFAVWTGWYLLGVIDGTSSGKWSWVLLGFVLALLL